MLKEQRSDLQEIFPTWRDRSSGAGCMDLAAGRVFYQVICTQVEAEPAGQRQTYGLQCLWRQPGITAVLDTVPDISGRLSFVTELAGLFNSNGLSHLHFRDAVLDSLCQL